MIEAYIGAGHALRRALPAAAATLQPSIPAPLLAVQDLDAWYGESHVLHGVSFDVRAGEVVTLLGRNGAGKTTTLKSIIGIMGSATGSVRFDGEETIKLPSRSIARLGIGYVPGGARHLLEPLRQGEPDAAADQSSRAA